MYVDKLKIVGFKSFARKTTFHFADRIIGVVGPNGCGKSNVVDAIRWVLGEQKAGTLRSDRMENVIFNGTKDVKPLGMAEVSVVILNTKNILPVEYSEVVITRRLFRSGESQYLINNSVCRLKDINDLLMDTGMAPDAYSVIELSMVESILSGKPEERRRIFEEAAGVTKYKQRRRITFRKLESTENDLIRVEDIIREVESKVNSLRRQVRAAERYKELTEKLKEIEIRYATHEYSTIYQELIPLSQQLEESKRERERTAAQSSFAEAETESLKTELIQVEQQLRSSQEELNKIGDLIRHREQEILLSRERIKSLAANDERLHREIDDLRKKISEHHDIVNRYGQDLEQIDLKIKREDDNYQQEKTNLEVIEGQLQEKRERVKLAESEKSQLFEQWSLKQSAVNQLKATAELLRNRIAELQGEKTTRSESVVLFRDELRNLEQKESGLIGELNESQTQQAQWQQQLADILAEIDREKEDIVNSRGQLSTMQHRIGIFAKLLEDYADYPEGVKYLMGQKQEYAGTVADVISIREPYRMAIESLLGEAATYLIADDAKRAFLGIQSLKESRKGIVTFLATDRFGGKEIRHPELDIDSREGIVGWADELVQCETRYRPLIQALLSDSLVIEDLTVYERLAKDLNAAHVTAVTLSGEMMAASGRIRGGRKSHDDSGFIGRRDQLNELHEQTEVFQAKIKAAEEKRMRLEGEQSALRSNIESVRHRMERIGKALSDIKINSSEQEYKISESAIFLQKADQEVAQLNDKIAEVLLKLDPLEQELEQHDQVKQTHEDHYSQFSAEMDAILAERNLLSERAHQTNVQRVQLHGEAAATRNNLERSKQIIVESENLIRNKQHDIEQNQRQNESLADRIEELTESLTADYDRKDEMDRVVGGIEEQQSLLKKNIEEKDKGLRKLRAERESVAERIHQFELRIAELKLNADNLYRRIGEEHSHDLKQEAIDASYDAPAELGEIENLKNRIKSLGLVNLLALKDYEVEKERLDFLSKQHDDLIQAKQNLNETVTHINQTAQEKFLTIFEQVRQNFNVVFHQFFRDGEADLLLAKDEDPLEATIEIMANPKGKRPTSLSLLSGGEKALTAISLLFSIYLVKPSPFCILDEVDAPLDDNNIKRFTEAIRTFSKETQFIMVTHNKMTMKAADSLYGITMEEPGISKVVSVKLE